MRHYEIYDGENKISIGTLIYYEKQQVYVIELQEYLDEWSAPLLFMNLVRQHIYTVPYDLSYTWVKDRIIPNDRQNITNILANHNMKTYDEMALLEVSKGKCSQDGMYIKHQNELPDYVLKRRSKKLKECILKDDYKAICFFEDGITRLIDLLELKECAGVKKITNNNELYKAGQVGVGGYTLAFDNSVFISADILYDSGKVIPVSLSDFISFVKNNICDTSESCELLGCSRQNVAYMVGRNQLHPIKEEIKGNIYLKSEVQRSTWD